MKDDELEIGDNVCSMSGSVFEQTSNVVDIRTVGVDTLYELGDGISYFRNHLDLISKKN